MANLVITYEDGSSQGWGLTEREADVSSYAIERLFGKPRISQGSNISKTRRTEIAEEENRRIRHLSSKSNL